MNVIEKQVTVSATPETIFDIYRDVENWKQWDPDTRVSNLNRGLTLGSKGTITPTKGRTVPMEITAIEANRYFTTTSKTPIFRIDFEHELTPIKNGTRVVHRVKFSGLLSPLLSRIIGPQIETGLPITLAQLKAQAEAVQQA